jgi:hypothetical protein
MPEVARFATTEQGLIVLAACSSSSSPGGACGTLRVERGDGPGGQLQRRRAGYLDWVPREYDVDVRHRGSAPSQVGYRVEIVSTDAQHATWTFDDDYSTTANRRREHIFAKLKTALPAPAQMRAWPV